MSLVPRVALLGFSALLLIAGDTNPPPLPRDTLPRDFFDLPTPLGLVPKGLDRIETPATPGAPASPVPPVPTDARERELFGLGRRLFFDPLISADRTVACASCHEPEHGFSSPSRFPRGVGGLVADRHSPTLFNREFGNYQLWDGRARTLEEQVLLPIEQRNEMGLPIAAALARLNEDASYRADFARVFAAPATSASLAAALAAFVRRLRFGDTAVDRFYAGDAAALTTEERGGLWIYESKGKCWVCHAGPNFSDESFHNTGVGVVDGSAEAGRAAITGDEKDRGAFKTPTLRALVLTPPYMHDGSLATLEAVVEFYRRGGNANAHLDARLAPIELSDTEVRDLVAFLRALTRQPSKAQETREL
ncbi:MAG: cytochrome-c peroxidase [Planctomycetota bacterium]